MSGYFSDLVRGAKSLIDGFAVTIKALLSAPVTVQYPRQKLPMSKGYRGHPVLVVEQGTGAQKCIACGACSRACPSQCITVEGEKKEGEKRKYPTLYILDFTRCSLCGTCVEICPVNALAYSDAYGLAGFSREAFTLDLIKLSGAGP